MADYTRQVIKLLTDNDCRFVRRGKGSHSTWHSPITDKNFTVVSSILKKTIANAVMHDAGINFKF